MPAASGASDSMPVEAPIEGEDGASAIKNNDDAAAAPHPVRAGINGFRSTIEVDGVISSIEFFLDFSYGEYGSARKGCRLSLCICSSDFCREVLGLSTARCRACEPTSQPGVCSMPRFLGLSLAVEKREKAPLGISWFPACYCTRFFHSINLDESRFFF